MALARARVVVLMMAALHSAAAGVSSQSASRVATEVAQARTGAVDRSVGSVLRSTVANNSAANGTNVYASDCPCIVDGQCATAAKCNQSVTVVAVLATLFVAGFGAFYAFVRVKRKVCCVITSRTHKDDPNKPARVVYCLSPAGCCATPAKDSDPCWGDYDSHTWEPVADPVAPAPQPDISRERRRSGDELVDGVRAVRDMMFAVASRP